MISQLLPFLICKDHNIGNIGLKVRKRPGEICILHFINATLYKRLSNCNLKTLEANVSDAWTFV